MEAVNFMYVHPPGYNAESAKATKIADETNQDQTHDPSTTSIYLLLILFCFFFSSISIAENKIILFSYFDFCLGRQNQFLVRIKQVEKRRNQGQKMFLDTPNLQKKSLKS